MLGERAVLDRHIPYLLFLDGFSIKKGVSAKQSYGSADPHTRESAQNTEYTQQP